MLRTPAASDWHDSVAYQVFVRSFRDGNGDRHGDFRGLAEQLDALVALGVDALWLNPIFPSSSYHNYFASDHFETDPDFGTRADFAALCRAAHTRGMRVLLDMETQYLPLSHAHYREALARADSPYRQWFLFRGPGTTEPVHLSLRMGRDDDDPVFEVRDVVTLDLAHPDVRDWQRRVFSFWLDPLGTGDREDGVDGFRLDHVMDDLDGQGLLTDLYASFWRPLLDDLRREAPQLFCVAEPADWGSYGRRLLAESGIDAVFAMPLMDALRSFEKQQIVDTVERTVAALPEGKHAFTLLENHDVERFATSVGSVSGRLRVGAGLLLTLPGTPTLYYGQELGMVGKLGVSPNDFHLPAREAFKWVVDPDAEGMATWYRERPFWSQSALTAASPAPFDLQRAEPASLWHLYRRLIALRRAHLALRRGSFVEVPTARPNVLAFARVYLTDEHAETLLVVVNLGMHPERAALELGPLDEGGAHVVLFEDATGHALERGELTLPLRLLPWEIVVARLG